MARSRSLPDAARLARLLDAVAPSGGAAAAPGPRTRVTAPAPGSAPSRRSAAASAPEPAFADGEPATRRLRILLDAAGSLERRLEALADWLAAETGAEAVFVTDQDGLPIANRNASEPHMAAASHLAYAHRKAGRYVPGDREATMALRLDDGRLLQLVTTPTWAGELTLGLVVRRPLTVAAATGLGRLVDETVRGGASARPAP